MTLARGERMAQYGHPIDNFRAIAAYWRTHVERKHGIAVDFDPDDVGAMMILLKLARDANQPKADNLDDISGYADCLRMTREAEEREARATL